MNNRNNVMFCVYFRLLEDDAMRLSRGALALISHTNFR